MTCFFLRLIYCFISFADLLSSQLDLAKVVCSDTPFSLILQKRLMILMRIFYAVTFKYHRKSSNNADWITCVANSGESRYHASTPICANDALIEMAVKTSLSLVFSLLKHNWALSAQVPALSFGDSTFCNDVLGTALDVIQGLPMLSLSNENKISTLAMSTLQQVSGFLTTIATATTG